MTHKLAIDTTQHEEQEAYTVMPVRGNINSRFAELLVFRPVQSMSRK